MCSPLGVDPHVRMRTQAHLVMPYCRTWEGMRVEKELRKAVDNNILSSRQQHYTKWVPQGGEKVNEIL